MIRVILPQTAQEVYDLAGDILTLSSTDPDYDPDILDYYATIPHALYLFYEDQSPMAMIRLDDRQVDPALGRNTVEIHGGILPQYRGQSDEPTLFVLRGAFKVKKNVIAKVDPGNLGALGWVRKWGFRKINREDGKDVYRLKRSEFNRINP